MIRLFLIYIIGLYFSTELSYEEEEIRLIVDHKQATKSVNLVNIESQLSSENSILSFHPSILDFKESPVGIPRLGIVRVENRQSDENVKLISISGSTLHFHSSFFADKHIAPGGNTTFEIVFLSRTEGQIESSLDIHTSKGLFKYQVQGHGLPNPYRLKPLVAAKIPINGTYEPLITMHNPHEDLIQVVEMLSSDEDFHLSLPDDVKEGEEATAWSIQPYQTKPLMKGSFQGKSEGNHTGYIKIRVNSSSRINVSSEYLIVPLEVQVSSTPGIYSPQDCLDFGLMVKDDKPKTLTLSLINAHQSPINVQSVTVKGGGDGGNINGGNGGNSAIKIEFRPLSLEPDNSVTTVVALVTFDPSKVHSLKETHGFIEILCGSNSNTGDNNSNDQLLISVPFRSNVLQGQLEYNSSTLGFFVNANRILPRNFSVRNSFTDSIVIYDVSISHPEIIQVQKLNPTLIIAPGELKDIFTIRVQKKLELCESPNQVQLILKSNITNLILPITCYDGKLDSYTIEENLMNFGQIELLSSHIEYFSVDNKNPVEVRLKSWNTNCSSCIIELVGMQKGEKEDLSEIQDFDSLKKSLFLQPNHMAVFSIEIRRPSVEGDFWAEAVVTTDHNQTIRVPFIFSVRRGAIHSDTITFDKTFPGKISFEKLHLTSTFNVTMTVRGIESTGNSPIWFTTSSMLEYPEVLPHGKNYIGKIHFDPKRLCGCDCYAGFNTESQIGSSWAQGMNISWDTGRTDWEIFRRLQKRFEQLKDSTFSNISLWVRTSSSASAHGTGYKLKTLVTYTWPRLTSSKTVVFPLTALGNHSLLEIPITNPSSSPLIVQALLAKDYGPLWTQFVQGQAISGNTTNGNTVFTFDGGLSSSSSQSNETSILFGQVQRQAVIDMLQFNSQQIINPPGIIFFLPSGARFHIRIMFTPNSKEMASTLLLLRNNLTGIETTWLKGRAGTGQLTIGNGIPGSALQFQITEKLLQGCHQREPTNKYVQPQLTVRRSFIARNVGEIPLDIQILEVYPPQNAFFWWPFSSTTATATAPNTKSQTGVGIQNEACEGYGFRILNCQPFNLLPNQTHSIDIAFSPDFTMSKILRTLRLTDATGVQFNYSLVAMVPSGMLKICSAAIARPGWEPILKYLLIFGIVIGIIAASLMAYFEAGTIVSGAVVATVRVVSPDSEELRGTCKFDLKTVYEKVDNRFKRNNNNQQQQQQQPQQQQCQHQLSKEKESLATRQQQPSCSTANSENSNLTIGALTSAAATASSSTSAASSVTNNNNVNVNVNVRNRKKKLNNNVPTEINLNHQQQQQSPKTSACTNSTTKSNNSNSNASSQSSTNGNNDMAICKTPPPSNTNSFGNKSNNNNNKKKKNKNNRNNRNKNNNSPTNSMNSNNTSKGESTTAAAEEAAETSSTTTETSSTSDDFNANLIALMEDGIGSTDGGNGNNNSNKMRKLSGKSNESEQSSTTSTTGGNSVCSGGGYENNNNNNNNKSKKKNKKGKNNKQRKNSKADLENVGHNKNQNNNNASGSGSGGNSAASSAATTTKGGNEQSNNNNKGKGQQKKKEQNGNRGSSNSPKQQQQDSSSLWDTPRPPSGDGLSELAAQTEAFVMQKPSRRTSSTSICCTSSSSQNINNNNDQQSPPPPPLGNSSLYNTVIGGQKQQPQPVSTGGYQNHNVKQQPQHFMDNAVLFDAAMARNQQAQQQNPGVIGQQRPLNTISPPVATIFSTTGVGTSSKGQQQQQNAGFINNVLSTTLALSLTNSSNNNNGQAQHIPSSRTLSTPSSPWGKEPDNGCDIWSRKLGNEFIPGSSQHLPLRGSSISGGTCTGGTTSTYGTTSVTDYGGGMSMGNNNGYSSPPGTTIGSINSLTPGLATNAAGYHPLTSSPVETFLFNNPDLLADELISSLWHCANFEGSLTTTTTNNNNNVNNGGGGYRTSPGIGNGNNNNGQTTSNLTQRFSPPLPLNSSNGGQNQQHGHHHGYVQRMRSDSTTNRLTSNSFFGGGIRQQDLELGSGLAVNNDSWSSSIPTSSTSAAATNSCTSLFNDWNIGNPLPPLPNNNHSPWETLPTEQKWPSFEKDGSIASLAVGGPRSQRTNSISGGTSTTTNSTSSVIAAVSSSVGGVGTAPAGTSSSAAAVGSGIAGGGGSSSYTDLRPNLQQDQSQRDREVEAGLGFNPFLTDIWKQGENNNGSSSSPGWTNT